MKINKLISMIMSLALIVTVNAVPVYAQSDNELLDLYKTYFEDESIIELEFIDNGYIIILLKSLSIIVR